MKSDRLVAGTTYAVFARFDCLEGELDLRQFGLLRAPPGIVHLALRKGVDAGQPADWLVEVDGFGPCCTSGQTRLKAFVVRPKGGAQSRDLFVGERVRFTIHGAGKHTEWPDRAMRGPPLCVWQHTVYWGLPPTCCVRRFRDSARP